MLSYGDAKDFCAWWGGHLLRLYSDREYLELRKFSESGYGTWYGGDAGKFLFKYELPAPVAKSTKNETC